MPLGITFESAPQLGCANHADVTVHRQVRRTSIRLRGGAGSRIAQQLDRYSRRATIERINYQQNIQRIVGAAAIDVKIGLRRIRWPGWKNP